MKKIIILIQVLLPLFVFSQKIASVSPSVGSNGQTLNVTITGSKTHFLQSNGTSVTFAFIQGSGTTIVNSTTVLNDSSITANITVPANTYTGDYLVSTYNSIDHFLSLNNAFHVNGIIRPSLSLISPSVASNGQTLDVIITGKNTHFSQGSGTHVDFLFNQTYGTSVVNSTNILNDSSINANISVPLYTPTGDYQVNVNNSIDGFLSMIDFHINGSHLPSLKKINPSIASNGQTLNVTITGVNTHFSKANGAKVGFGFNQGSGTTFANSLTVANDSSLEANVTVPAYTRTGDFLVSVSNSLDGNLFLNNGFHVNGVLPPSIVSVSPSEAVNGQTLNVTFTGTHTHFSQMGGETSVDFYFYPSGGIIVNSKNVINDSSLEVNITVSAKAYTGDYQISIVNSIDGNLPWKKGFHVNGIMTPSLVSISPVGARPGQTLSVTITGKNTHFNQASATSVGFNFNQASPTTVANSSYVSNDSSIIANITIPQGLPVGSYKASLYNNLDGQLCTNFYIYENCFSHFFSGYNDTNNKFTLKMDSVTSASGAKFYWDFDDGSTSTLETPMHTFALDTVYNVCLKIITTSGDSCSYCHVIGKMPLDKFSKSKVFL